jgi:hypothetical protein
MINKAIPKIIHLCWFSGDPFPAEIKYCMDTWKKVLPDYKIRLWTMKDALSLHCKYVDETLLMKKWATAADVVRLYAIYTEGGVYMDSDIFLKRRFDDFMTDKFVTFHECEWDYFKKEVKRNPEEEVPFGLQAAFMMGEKGNPFCKALLDHYYTLRFINPDKSLNTRIAPFIYADVAEKYGYIYKNVTQHLPIGVTIYDSKNLALRKQYQSPDCFAVHRISHSWKNFNDYPLPKRFEKTVRHYYKTCKYFLFKTC